MVTAMMLRIVLYAPIIGLGGVYKVAKTGANMEWIIALAVLVIIGFVGTLVSITMPKFKMMQKAGGRIKPGFKRNFDGPFRYPRLWT